jgi:hypothetical protein
MKLNGCFANHTILLESSGTLGHRDRNKRVLIGIPDIDYSYKRIGL